MRPLDLFMEKQMCDRSVDLTSSRALSREINGITLREWMEQSKSLSSGDKMSIASASIALGSPFFLLSLGATFAIMDECDNRRIERELEELLRAQGASSFKNSRDLTNGGSLEPKMMHEIMAPAALMSMDFSMSRAMKPRKETTAGKDQAVFTSKERRGENCKFLIEDNSWLKASKVLKQKFFLQDELERVNGCAEFSMVAGIVAQIERLDRELKRLGC